MPMKLVWLLYIPLCQTKLAETDAKTSFLIYLDDQAQLEPEILAAAAGHLRGQLIYQRLTNHAMQSQASILAWLDRKGIDYRAFYLINMIEVEGDAELADALRRHPDVHRLLPDPVIDARLRVEAPPSWVTFLDEQAVQATAVPPYGLTYTNADDVWALGYTGQNIVIANQDTGVDWAHNALKPNYRGWRSDTQSVDHVYNWFDAWGTTGRPATCSADPQVPCDDHGHGTHTVGTLMGDATVDGGTRIGMAPDATWIGCRNMRNGIGTPASYTACFQFFLAPYPQDGDPFIDGRPDQAPHIISNSWSCPPSEGCDVDSLRRMVETVRAAGQWVIAAAGNEGSGCSTVLHPISIHDATTSIGAHDNSGSIAGFSSRGPVTADGSGRLKPDLSAPGVSVYSTRPNNQYGNASGTSMATPHVAGAAALLWSAVPSLIGDVDRSEQILLKSATPVPVSSCSGGSEPVSPNNVYGHGRLDILAAVNMALSPGSVTIRLLDAFDQPSAGQTVTLTDYRTGFVVTAVSDVDGVARYAEIFDGTYTVRVPNDLTFAPLDTAVIDGESVALTLQASEPLAVPLADHRLSRVDGRVVVAWQTFDENGFAGFHLLRRADDGAWTRLTNELLPATGPFIGDTYRFVDENPPIVNELEYALRLVYIGGREVQIELGSVALRSYLFLPIAE